MITIAWRNNLVAGIDAYERHTEQRISQLATQLAQRIEQWMQSNAPWTDQTSDARSGLFAIVDQVSRDLVEVYFSHGESIDYGIWLEVRNAGRYAIIRPALEQIAIPELQRMMREIFA